MTASRAGFDSFIPLTTRQSIDNQTISDNLFNNVSTTPFCFFLSLLQSSLSLLPSHDE